MYTFLYSKNYSKTRGVNTHYYRLDLNFHNLFLDKKVLYFHGFSNIGLKINIKYSRVVQTYCANSYTAYTIPRLVCGTTHASGG